MFTVNTHDPTTGAETDADAAPTYRVYEDETGTAILTGSMALLDDANTVGHYSEQITLSAANGFEKGKSYNIRIRGVVGGVAGATTRSLQVEAEVDANTASGNPPNLDAAVSTLASQASVDDLPTNAELATALGTADDAVLAELAKVPKSDGSVSWNATALTAVADALLKRDFSAISGESARSMLNALRKLMNKWSISGLTLTVCKEDDSTTAYTQTLATSAGADPIISADTN